MALTPTDRFVRNEHIVTREILGETLLVPISVDVADMDNIFALNDTGAHVWHRLDGALTLAGICEALVDAFDVSEEQAWDDIHTLVDDLLDAGLINKVE
ncbi:MAG: hypothetical protein ACI8W7_001455 [Gammaproteobacteria bacterium]|jgi:hypothetical protein